MSGLSAPANAKLGKTRTIIRPSQSSRHLHLCDRAVAFAALLLTTVLLEQPNSSIDIIDVPCSPCSQDGTSCSAHGEM